MRVSKGVSEGLKGSGGSRRVLEGLGGSGRVWEGLLLKGFGRVQEGLGGSRMVLRRSRRVRESIEGTEGSMGVQEDPGGSGRVSKVPRGFGGQDCQEVSRIVLEGLIRSWSVWEGPLLK